MTSTLTGPTPRVRRGADPSRSRLSAVLSMVEVRWAGLATALFALGSIAQLAGAPAGLWWALHLSCYVAGGWEPALSGLRALRARTLDVDHLAFDERVRERGWVRAQPQLLLLPDTVRQAVLDWALPEADAASRG